MIRPDYTRRRPLSAALCAMSLLSVGALLCDSSSSSASTSSGATGLASESPAQIITATQSALRSADGYVIAGEMTQGKQKLKLQVTYGGSSKLKIELSQEGTTAAIIALPGGAYIKANKAYWQSQGGGAALRYAGLWIQLPASYSTKFTKQLGQFNPKTLATCLGENHGTLTNAGTTTVDGKRAVVIRDAGGVPGTSPGTLDIATAGPADPLRVTSTGPTLKGGKVGVCDDGKASDLEGSLTLSRFNNPPAITAPANPVKLSTTTSTTTSNT